MNAVSSISRRAIPGTPDRHSSSPDHRSVLLSCSGRISLRGNSRLGFKRLVSLKGSHGALPNILRLTGEAMPMRWVILTCMLLLGSAGTSEATPLDSPDIVYIDGLPCNSACQSYLARSREKTAPASSNDTDHLVAILIARPEIKSVSDLTGKDIAIDDRHSASNGKVRTAMAAAGATEVQLSGGQTKVINRLISGEVPAAVLALVYPEAAEWFPEIAGFKIFRIPLSPRSLKARPEPAGNAAADSNTRAIQQQVAAAMALAEQVTAATGIPAPEQKATNKERSDRSETVLREAEKAVSASPNNTDPLVALVMARPEIRSVSDLTGKDIAIDDRHSASNGKVRTAMAAAGATEVQLSEGQTKAINRLISGEVPAAVLTLVSPEAAEWFPEIAGFKIFRIPLSSSLLQARPEPAGNAAADSNTRAIQQQVKVATVIAEHVMTLRDAAKTASALTSNTDHLVAIVMARPEIRSVSDLTSKIIAIDDRHSASNARIQTAMAAAGAAEVQLSEGQTRAIDRLIRGEVPAAVLTLVYPETGFSEIAGFKIFRIPLFASFIEGTTRARK